MISNPIRFFLSILALPALVLGAVTADGSWRGSQVETAGRQPDAYSKQAQEQFGRITPEQAQAAAMNDLQASGEGFILQHPRHEASFTPEGVAFRPRNGTLAWSWRLTAVEAGDVPLTGIELGAMQPTQTTPLTVVYQRGGLVEQYLGRKDTLEQQFLIPQPLRLDGADLVIAGEVQCQGSFEAGSFKADGDGWLWRLGDQEVHLGKVRAFDAAGQDLSTSMQVSASGTRITVDGKALASAVYPVTVDPEVRTNDMRVSYMNRDLYFDAYNPAVAYNSVNNEFLVVWYADHDENFLADDEFEIYAQRVNATDGSLAGEMIAVSNMGTNGYDYLDAYNPAVAYDSANNQYLVVWEADINNGGLVNDEFEIYGQLLTAAGAEIGVDDFRISDMGPDGDANYDAIRPAVAYNSTNSQYLVVWQGDNGAPLADDENEIYGQFLTSSGDSTGSNDFRISDMGPNGDANYDASSPAVTYNSQDNQYLVVWSGSDNNDGMVIGESEIFGQLMTSTGAGTGSNDFRISDMGGSGNAAYDAYSPDVAYNSHDNQYLVVWYGDDNAGALVDEEFEIYGQLMTATGSGTGTNDFRISSMGPDGSIAYRAEDPSVIYNSQDNQYLVVWAGIDDTPPLEAGEQEIFGQRLYASGVGVGTNDFRISYMGPNGNSPYWAYHPAVGYNSQENKVLINWYGDDDRESLINDEYEVFGSIWEYGANFSSSGKIRISYMDPKGNPAYDAADPAVAISGLSEALVVWSGDTNLPPLVDNEQEIFGYYYNQFRISHMGTDGSPARGAYEPAVAFNSTDYEFLVVWWGDNEATDNEFEIYGQRVDTSNGSLIGTNFRISDMGPDGSAAYAAYTPDVAYNSTNNQYLVVWSGDDNTGSLVDNEYEIYGQLLTASGGETGNNDFRISDMGGTGNALYGASEPAVTYNSDSNEYLVVWQGDDNTAPLVDNEFEIRGQLVEANGDGVAGTPNDFFISDMGGYGDPNYGAYSPDVVWNGEDDQYLVVWYGDDNASPLVNDEYEIFGQDVTYTGGRMGANDFRISDMGPDGDANYDAYNPAVVYSSEANQYMVTWYGDDGAPLADDEFEIYGQVLTGGRAETGENDVRLSDMGPDGDPGYSASEPVIVSAYPYFAVFWEGDDNTLPLVNGEDEIFLQIYDPMPKIYLPLVSKSP